MELWSPPWRGLISLFPSFAVYSSNDNFKKRLLPLEGHRAMMEAVGFKAKGSLWEWTWHEDM